MFPHVAGYWAKKIRGRFHYSAPRDQPDEALSLYREYADYLPTGRITEVPKNGAEKASVSRNGRNGKPRPKKPYPDFPLFPHAAGQWAKNSKAKVHYYGPWTDPQASLDEYLAQKDDLFAGRTPRTVTEDGCTGRDLVNRFLAGKEQLVDSRELSQRCYRKERGKKGPRMFEANQIRDMLDTASKPMKARQYHL